VVAPSASGPKLSLDLSRIVVSGAAAATYGLAVPLAVSAVFFGLGGGLIWLLPETKGATL